MYATGTSWKPTQRMLSDLVELDLIELKIASRLSKRRYVVNYYRMKSVIVHNPRAPEIHTVTAFYRVDVVSGDVEMNDEHCDYRWITGDAEDLHPFVREMITRSEIF